MKKVLILGAGLVSRPGVHHLGTLEGVSLTVASLYREDAEKVASGLPHATVEQLDVRGDAGKLERLVAEHDLAVSLLPATEHPHIADLCVKHQKHMATSSYISEHMRLLDGPAQQAGLTLLNECGVDPGLDHMSAMSIIDSARQRGGKVTSFRSYCGGLPAPEANNNPIGYKFSWAPRGVLVAAANAARYLKDGVLVEIPGPELFAKPELVLVQGMGQFEGYPNRDSLAYIPTYGLEGIRTMFRGTLRNLGHCAAWYRWSNLGLFDQTNRPDLKGLTYRRFLEAITGGTAASLEQDLARKMNVAMDAPAVKNLVWLGLLEDEPIGLAEGGAIDVLAKRMTERCAYKQGERDMLVMQHELTVEYQERTEHIVSSLVDYGIPFGDSSMARTVTLPLALAIGMILDGRITRRGVVAPVTPDFYEPILKALEPMGIAFQERTRISSAVR